MSQPVVPNAYLYNGVYYTWEQIVFKLSTGAWTLEQAAHVTAMPEKHLVWRLQMIAQQSPHLAGQIATALRVAGQQAAKRFGLAWLAAKLGLSVAALLGILGLAALAGAGGYYVYNHGVPWGDDATAADDDDDDDADDDDGDDDDDGADGENDERVCAPKTMHKTKCPWTPKGFAVNACAPGYCWDGGPRGTLACKQRDGVANAHRSYTRDVLCDDGYRPTRDRCTNVVNACVPAR